MDISSIHTPYILASYALAFMVLVILSIWIVKQDRQIRKQLSELISDDT